MCFPPQQRALFRHLNFQKCPRLMCFVHFELKRAFRHNGVHFFDISTSKSGPRLVCFVHFELKTCFPPQRRALFRHRNFSKCCEAEVFCTFWLGNVLRATTACNFSSLIWPAGSAPAALASLLFNLPEPNHWKNTVNRDFPTFSHTRIFLLPTLSLLCSSHFLTSPPPDSSHFCFSISAYCRKFDF